MSTIWGPFFWEKKAPAATYPQVQGFQKYGGPFFWKKKAPAATYPQVQGFQKSRGHFCGKTKALAATYPQVQGFQKCGGHFSEKIKRLRQRSQPLRASKSLGPFFKNILSGNRLLIFPIMVTQKSIWSKSHSGYCFRLPLAWNLFEPAISGHSGQVRSALWTIGVCSACCDQIHSRPE